MGLDSNKRLDTIVTQLILRSSINPLLIFTERYLLETHLELYLNPSKATFAIILFDSALETISSIILPILPVAILGHEPVLHQ